MTQILFTGDPTQTNNIIRGATTTDATTFAGNATGFNLATYGANGVAAQTSLTALPTSGGSATTNYIATASTALTGNVAANAVLIVGDGVALSGAAGTTLTLTTGTLASTGGTATGNTVSVPVLALGASDGIFLANTGTTTIGSSITGTAGLTIGGAGTLILAGANTNTGSVMVNPGVVQVPRDTGLGGAGGVVAGAGVAVGGGATLQLQGTITVPGKALTLSGAGFGNTNNNALSQGALANNANNNTWTGSVAVTGTVGLTGGNVPLFSAANTGSSIGAVTGTTLTITGVVTGTDLTKVGAGAVALNAANTYTGNTTVLGGPLTLANTNTAATGTTTVSGMATNGAFTAGQITLTNLGTLGTGAITLDQGGTLLLDNTLSGANLANANVTRLTNATKPAVTSNSGSLVFQAMNLIGAASAEAVGAVTLNTGQSVINSGLTAVPAAGATATLTAASLARNPGATANFLGGTGNFAPLGLVNNTITATGTFTGGSFTLTYNGQTTAGIQYAAGIASLAEVGNVVTVTTSANHGFLVGQQVAITGASVAGYNITATITAVTPNTFSYTDATAALGAATGGTATLTQLGMVNAVQAALNALTNVGAGINGTNPNGDGNFLVSSPTATTFVVSTVNQLAGSTLPVTLTPTGVTGGTFAVLNPTGTANRVLFTAAPTALQFTGTQGSILPFAEVNGGSNTGDLATYGATGVAPFANYLVQNVATGTFAATLAGGPNDIVKVVTNNSTGTQTTISGAFNQTVGALVFANANLGNNAAGTTNNAQINPTGALAVVSGAVLTLGSSTSTNASNTVSLGAGAGAPFVFGGESFLFQNAQSAGNTNFNGPIAGPGTLVVAGTNTVYLNTTSNAALTGGVTLNAGTMIVQGSGNFGTGPLTLVGGSFNPNAAQQVFSNPVTVNGAVTFAGGQNSVFTGPITLAGNAVLTTANNVVFAGVVGGPGALVEAGGGASVFLTNANTFTGGTVLAAGNVQVGHNAGLGAAALTVAGGALLPSNTALTISNAINVANATFTVNNNGQGYAVNFAGPLNVTGNATLAGGNTGVMTFSGPIAGAGGLTVTAATFQFQGSNTFTGGVTLSSVTPLVGSSGAFGTGPVALSGATVLAPAPVTLANPIVATGTTTTITAAALAALSNVGAAANVSVIASSATLVTVTFQGALAGSPWPTMGATSNLTGTAPTVTAAALVAGVASPVAALGTGTLTLSAGVLQAAGPVTLANAVTANAGPVGFAGSAITLTGAVNVAATPTWAVGTLTSMTGVVSGTVGATLSSAPLPAVTGIVTPTGNLVLSGVDTLSGTVAVNGGTLTLGGGGTLGSLTALTVNTGGTVVLDNTATRIAAGANVALNGGTLSLLGSAAGASVQTSTGGLTLGSGNSTVNVTAGTGQTATLTFNTLARNAGATANVTAGLGQTLGGSPKVDFTTTPSALVFNNVLKGLTTTDATTFAGNTTGFNLANYAASGVVAQTAYTALPTSGGSSTTNYIAPAGTTTLTGAVAANAVLVVGDGISINGTGSLNLGTAGSAGVIAATGGTSTGDTISVPVLLGVNEGVVHTGTGTATLSGAITGTAGVTVGGSGTLALSGLNAYTGTTTLNSGTLAIGQAAALPTASPLALTGGTLQAADGFAGPSPLSLGNAVTFTNSVVTFGGAVPIDFTGGTCGANTTTLTGTTNVLSVAPGSQATVANQVTGAGALTKLGGGTLTLSNQYGAPSTYTGQTTVAAGALNVQSGTALGSSSNVAVVSGAALQLQALPTLSGFAMGRPLFLYGSGVGGNGAIENVFGFNTFAGTTVNAPATIGVDAGVLTQATAMGGPGDITKAGGGMLVLNQANSFLGQLTLNNGVVQVTAQTFALGAVAGGVVVNPGSTLLINNGGGQFTADTITLNGTGYAGFNLAGALVFTQGTTYDGNIVVNPGSSFGVAAGAAATLGGIVSGAGALTKVGAGTLTLVADSTYTGNTVVNGGTLQLQGSLTQGGGVLLNTAGVVVNPGASFVIDNTNGAVTGNVTNRLPDAAPITLNAGTLQYLANPGVGVAGVANSETVGTITIGPGASTINVGYTGAPVTGTTSTLTATSLVRTAGGTVSFVGNNSALGTSTANRLAFGTVPATHLDARRRHAQPRRRHRSRHRHRGPHQRHAPDARRGHAQQRRDAQQQLRHRRRE